MKLTRKKAIELSIELWEWLAETGAMMKLYWPKWKEYGYANCDCFLCEYGFRKKHSDTCLNCPLKRCLGYSCYGTAYGEWEDARTEKDRKKYAKLFLEQLKALK